MSQQFRPFGIPEPVFVVQKHKSRQLHYDFRLEIGGVMVSWAIPKGPTLSNKQKRLAMKVDDHSLEYSEFEGIIPAGSYGAGTVIIWDYGKFIAHEPADEAIKKGSLKFSLDGKKLKGKWFLMKFSATKRRGSTAEGGGKRQSNAWLLIKEKDEFTTDEFDITVKSPESAVSGKTLEEVAADPNAKIADCTKFG